VCRFRSAHRSVGWDNCNCHGSYKFPVPPQYTYFWPGMYSQQTMTEYNDPYRFPPLNPPEEAFSSPGGSEVLPTRQTYIDPMAGQFRAQRPARPHTQGSVPRQAANPLKSR